MKPTVLVAHDLGEEAGRALAWAADLVRSTSGRLVVLYVIDLLPRAAAAPAPFEPPALVRQEVESIEQTLHRACDALGLPADVRVVIGTGAAATIVEAAGELHVDLVVVGTHGRTGLERFFLGSVAEEVVRKAPCPVLVVRPTP